MKQLQQMSLAPRLAPRAIVSSLMFECSGSDATDTPAASAACDRGRASRQQPHQAQPSGPHPRPPGRQHQAIEQHDLAQLRELLDAGTDAEDETQDGLTLLRHAIHREHTARVERGGPLHVGMTVLLLARGADPHHLRDGTSIETEAEILGHWLAAEVTRAWKPAPR